MARQRHDHKQATHPHGSATAVSSCLVAHFARLETIWLTVRTLRSRATTEAAVDDVLRLYAVYSHAMLEDTLRTLMRWKLLKSQNHELLKEIPIVVGESARQRQQKIGLAELRALGQTSASEIVDDSVRLYCDRLTFNNRADLESAIKSLGLDSGPAKELIGAVHAHIQRRHRIVHRGDLEDTSVHTDITLDDNERWVLLHGSFATMYLAVRVARTCFPREHTMADLEDRVSRVYAGVKKSKFEQLRW